jgi:hypothetical protein
MIDRRKFLYSAALITGMPKMLATVANERTPAPKKTKKYLNSIIANL